MKVNNGRLAVYTYTLYNIFQHIVISTQGVYRHKVICINLQPFKQAYTESREGKILSRYEQGYLYKLTTIIFILEKNIYINVIVVDYFYTFEIKIIGLLHK